MAIKNTQRFNATNRAAALRHQRRSRWAVAGIFLLIVLAIAINLAILGLGAWALVAGIIAVTTTGAAFWPITGIVVGGLIVLAYIVRLFK